MASESLMLEWIDGGNGDRFTIMGNNSNYKALVVKPLEPVKLGGYRCYVNGQLLGRFKTPRAAMRHAENIAAAQLTALNAVPLAERGDA
jgi:hypothetical protein